MWAIISLGGSIIVPREIDVVFLKKFRRLILSLKNHRFVIICGGGATNRKYNAAVKKITKPMSDDLDWLGIKSLQLNAELVRVMFGNSAFSKVIDDPRKLKQIPKTKIIVGAAFEPGHSSDYDSVLWAKRLQAKTVINLSNIKKVYTADPKIDKKAKPIDEISWLKYLKIIGTKWSPRLSTPFDPTAAKLAKQLGLSVFILNGRDIKNVRRAILGQEFRGTVIGKRFDI